jgi:hypothetical protein
MTPPNGLVPVGTRLLVGLLLTVAACVGNATVVDDDQNGGGGGEMDMAVEVRDLTPLPDLTRVRDLAGLIPEPCGNTKCAVGQKCCFTGQTGTCMDSCPDGAFSFACYGPQDCLNHDPCCITLSNSQPTNLACTTHPGDCKPSVDFSGNGQTRFCNVDADCTAGGVSGSFNKCCSGTFMGQPGKICFDPNLASFAKLKCN